MWSRVGEEVARRGPATTGSAPAAAPAPKQQDQAAIALVPPQAAGPAASSRPAQQRLLPALSWRPRKPASASSKGRGASETPDESAAAGGHAIPVAFNASWRACEPEAASSSAGRAASPSWPHASCESSDAMDSDDDEFAPDLFARSKVAQGVSNRGKQLACEFEVDTDDSDNGGEVTGSDVTLGEGGTGDDTSDDETATARPAPAQPKRQRPFYGASGISSVARVNTEGVCRKEGRKGRPSHAEYALQQCAPDLVRSLVIDDHKCHHTWRDEQEEVQCHHQLWARSITGSVDTLRQARCAFLAMGTKDRGSAVLAALAFDESQQLHAGAGAGVVWKPPIAKVIFRVGPSADRQRTVCRCIFLARYPVSLATLKRIVQRKRIGVELYSRIGYELRKESISVKTLHVISWVLEYNSNMRGR